MLLGLNALGLNALGTEGQPFPQASVAGNAPGARLTGIGSISGGAASGTGPSAVNATAPGANLIGPGSISGGAASGSGPAAVNATAPGAVLTGTGSISAGTASGTSAPASSTGTITVPATRTAVFPGRSRVAVFSDSGPVKLTKVLADQLYFVGDFTKPLGDGATTAQSVAFSASGVVVLSGPQLQGPLCVVKLGALDPAGGSITFEITCANGEVIDGTIILTPPIDATPAFGKDPEEHRFYAFDVSADLALSNNTSVVSVQAPFVVGVAALVSAVIQGSKVIPLIGGLDLSDGAINSCTLTMTLATTEVINRTVTFSRRDH